MTREHACAAASAASAVPREATTSPGSPPFVLAAVAGVGFGLISGGLLASKREAVFLPFAYTAGIVALVAPWVVAIRGARRHPGARVEHFFLGLFLTVGLELTIAFVAVGACYVAYGTAS